MKIVLKEFTQSARREGAILFAVCRGKVSEGIDFADEMARAVILIGVPYPPIKDKRYKMLWYQYVNIWFRLELKQDFLDKKKAKCKNNIGGSEWYIQQTIRAINQVHIFEKSYF